MLIIRRGWVRDVEPDDETRAEGNKVQRVKPQDVDVISWGRVKAKVLLDTVKSHGGVVTPISPTGHARLWTYHTHLLTRYLESAQKFSWDQIESLLACPEQSKRSEKDCQHLIKGHRYQIPAFQTRGLQGEAQASHAEAQERR
ncbi:uncharacterized protein CIMG_13289 [Coccidioides immitis RS]|uniref:Uncharacterized protein n=1 Tax=Coccidioides immitis (strain RS) TaxID=246410 RepID=J3K4C1_COCIM|nr:uncharacterized protein CIMG_13289 [Coccidioides immitis RS]EAS29138.3 hypothetical protein CIMG_13289 [Coccidioides immitis RS]